MSQVPVVINGRAYEIACEDGQEEQLQALGDEISRRVDDLVRAQGQIGDTRLLLMASILVADELSTAQDEIARLHSSERPGGQVNTTTLAQAIEMLAERIEGIAARLEAA